MWAPRVDRAQRAPIALAQCQNGLPARKNPIMIAATVATAKANHTHLCQEGRNRGGRGSVSTRV